MKIAVFGAGGVGAFFGGLLVRALAERRELKMDYRAAAAHLNEAQKRIGARVPELDWAHRPAEQIAPSTFRWS